MWVEFLIPVVSFFNFPNPILLFSLYFLNHVGCTRIRWTDYGKTAKVITTFQVMIQCYCKLNSLGLLICVGTNFRLTDENHDGHHSGHEKCQEIFFSCLHQLRTIGFDYISHFLYQVRVSGTSLCGLVELILHILFSDYVLSFLYLSIRSINPLQPRLSYPEVSIYMSSSRDSEIKLLLLSCSTLMPTDSCVH